MDRDTQRHHHHHSSYTSFFTLHPIIRGYPNENIGGGRAGVDMYQGGLEMREAILREIVKERIRGEIIAEEIERRRILEIEVRNEMIMERHMAMRSSEGRVSAMMRLSLPPSHINLFEQRSLNPQPIHLEERIFLSIDEKLGCESRGSSVTPFQPCGDSLKIKETPTGVTVVPFQRHDDSLETKEIFVPPEDNKKDNIVLGKPYGEILSGTKQKLTSPTAECSSNPRADSSKKKVKMWSCVICQVSTTSAHALNDHLQGKKHKVKEADFIAKKTGANFGLGVTPKKRVVNPWKLALTTANVKKSVTKKAFGTGAPNDTKSESKKKREIKRDKYPFWCEMCQAGAVSEKIMNIHKKGKKHLTNLAKVYRNGKVNSEAPASEKFSNAEENSEMDMKKAVVENMVAFEDRTKAETETENAVVLEDVTDEKSERGVNKPMIVEVVETVQYGMENVTAGEAETVMDDKENVAEDANI
uniref:uncharacterized protein LOC122593399 isoform X2 n=1 Tax=Erigeron canadensis TaxID=72917 RepID=UPI001CB98FFA|nr:uncharacterized protein LOC122593399 isoform X2 [Erigeron canadensis]